MSHADVKEYPPCEEEPTESDVSAAKGAFEAGQVSFQEADYERALLYWEDAFRRDCTAVKLLLNLALAYELSGDRKSAVNALKTYVDRRPDARDRSSVDERIAKLQKFIDAEEKEAAPPPKENDEKKPEPASDEGVSGSALEQDPAAADRPKRPIWPIILVGGGLTLTVASFAAIGAAEAEREAKAEELGCNLTTSECDTPADSDEVNEAGQEARATGGGLFVLGTLLGATGGALWYYVWTRPKYDAPKTAATGSLIVPVITPRYQGLTLQGTF